MCLQCLEDFRQHKIDERPRLPLSAALADGIVISLLVGIYHILNWEMLKQGMQLAENQGLPQTPRAAIAVQEGMDKLEFIMEHAGADEQMVFAVFQPVEEVAHQNRHPFGRRSHMNYALLAKHAHAPASVTSRMVD